MKKPILPYLLGAFLGSIVALPLYVPWLFMQPLSAAREEPAVVPGLILALIGATAGAIVAWALRHLLRLRDKLSDEVTAKAAFLEMSVYPVVGGLIGFGLATVVGSILSPAALIGLGTTITPRQLPIIVCELSIVGAVIGAFAGILVKLMLELLHRGAKDHAVDQ